MEEKKNVAVVTCDHSVINHPGAENANMYAKILKCLGYDVYVIGFDAEREKDECFIREEIKNINYSVKIPYSVGTGVFKRSSIKKAKMTKFVSEVGVGKVYVYMGEYGGTLYKLIKSYCKKNGGTVICQVCEWYDKKKIFIDCDTLTQKVRGIYHYVGIEYARRHVFVKNKNVIVVSTLLRDYYEKHNCRCMLMPNLLDVVEQEPKFIDREKSKKLKLGYFGSPGTHNCKDSLVNVVLGIHMLGEEKRKSLSLDIYGVSQAELSAKYDVPAVVLEDLRDVVVAHGRVAQKEIRNLVKNMDFTVLLRENTRSNNCGLSSKVEESMANGIPIICNLTSDMGLYIIDGSTGLVCKDEKPESFANALKRALMLSEDEMTRYKENAYRVARASFDYKEYVEKFRSYLKTIE